MLDMYTYPGWPYEDGRVYTGRSWAEEHLQYVWVKHPLVRALNARHIDDLVRLEAQDDKIKELESLVFALRRKMG